MSDLDWPVTVVLFDQERYDGEWMPTKLSDAIAWLQDMLDQIPDEYKDAAKIEIDSRSDYDGGHYAGIEVSYTRPPTDEERAERAAAERARQKEFAAREVAALRYLQAKYGGKP